MNKLEQEANNWMKERKMMSSITAVSYTHLTLPTKA